MNLQELVERYSDAAAEYGAAITDAERANVEMQAAEEAVREAIEKRDAVMHQMAEALRCVDGKLTFATTEMWDRVTAARAAYRELCDGN